MSGRAEGDLAELLAWRQQRLSELEEAQTRVKIEAAALTALDAESQATAELNQLKQLIQRIEMDEFRTGKELDSRYALMSDDDDDDVSIDDAPPDCEDRTARVPNMSLVYRSICTVTTIVPASAASIRNRMCMWMCCMRVTVTVVSQKSSPADG